ncbi:MAG: RimK family alpha-L-glutamate ligase [Chloroflexia bacterium]
MPDVGLITCARFPDLAQDDQLLLEALTRQGLRAEPVVWDDPAVKWHDFRLGVLRSTWDYHLRLPEFLAWAERVTPLTKLWNPLPVIKWNTHKSYMLDLAARGVPVVPTTYLKAGTSVDLGALLSAAGWDEVVIKPAISLYGHETILVSAGGTSGGQEHIDRLLPTSDLLVQPYMRAVLNYQERSLIYIDGELTHAVSRPPMLIAESGATEGSSKRITPAGAEVALAESALNAVGLAHLYARVDMVRDASGAPVVMELEMVEPSLFFELTPEAAEKMASAIASRLDASS